VEEPMMRRTKDIGRSWNVVALAGFGARDQITTTIGYRF
jgi:hypothetical protein